LWGNITGTLIDSQSDLALALSQKQPLDARLTALAALDMPRLVSWNRPVPILSPSA
jgi:hypothetical protein